MRYVASPAKQRDARVDSHSIFAFLRIGFLRLIAKNSIKNIKLIRKKIAFRTLTLHKALRHPRGALAPRNVRESDQRSCSPFIPVALHGQRRELTSANPRHGVNRSPTDIRARSCAPVRPSSPRCKCLENHSII